MRTKKYNDKFRFNMTNDNDKIDLFPSKLKTV